MGRKMNDDAQEAKAALGEREAQIREELDTLITRLRINLENVSGGYNTRKPGDARKGNNQRLLQVCSWTRKIGK